MGVPVIDGKAARVDVYVVHLVWISMNREQVAGSPCTCRASSCEITNRARGRTQSRVSLFSNEYRRASGRAVVHKAMPARCSSRQTNHAACCGPSCTYVDRKDWTPIA